MCLCVRVFTCYSGTMSLNGVLLFVVFRCDCEVRSIHWIFRDLQKIIDTNNSIWISMERMAIVLFSIQFFGQSNGETAMLICSIRFMDSCSFLKNLSIFYLPVSILIRTDFNQSFVVLSWDLPFVFILFHPKKGYIFRQNWVVFIFFFRLIC